MSKHQLENGMYCVPKDIDEAKYIASYIDSYDMAYNQQIACLFVEPTYWFSSDKHKQGILYRCSSFGSILPLTAEIVTPGKYKEIPVTEFIQRLKGAWNENT